MWRFAKRHATTLSLVAGFGLIAAGVTACGAVDPGGKTPGSPQIIQTVPLAPNEATVYEFKVVIYGVGTCDRDRWERLHVLAAELVERERAAA